MKEGTGNPKIKGVVLAKFEGLTITAELHPAKRDGQNRMWIQIRQNDKAKKWRQSEVLGYRRAIDIEFVEDQS